jgi:tetratricopeptide (TPR) repeat protein
MSYRHLAYISYLHGKVEQALELVTQGLHTYIEHETRNYPKFRLLMDRVIYLETLKRYIDAFEEVCRIWSIRHEIPITRLRLELTDLYARGLCRKHQYKEAETLLKDAIYLARLDYDHDMGYILWTTVGELYTELGDIEEAKNCYQTAIALTKQVQNKKILPRTYRLLGSLYTKEQEWSLADQYLGEAIRLSKRHNNEREFLYSLKAAGKVYLFRKQYERAIRFFERALVMAKHSDEHEEILLLTARCAKHLNQNQYNNLIDRLFELRGML